MDAGPAQIAISRVFDAPRALVYRAFTDPDEVAAWWGPIGSERPRDQFEFDVRPGGHQRWIVVAPSDPDVRVQVHIDLTDVADGERLEGVIHVSGRMQEGIEPFETRFQFEFHDEPDGRTRLEIRQWLPEPMTGPSEAGWREAFSQLDARLRDARAGSAPTVEV